MSCLGGYWGNLEISCFGGICGGFWREEPHSSISISRPRTHRLVRQKHTPRAHANSNQPLHRSRTLHSITIKVGRRNRSSYVDARLTSPHRCLPEDWPSPGRWLPDCFPLPPTPPAHERSREPASPNPQYTSIQSTPRRATREWSVLFPLILLLPAPPPLGSTAADYE